MYGDTTRIRALADRLRERATEIRALADRLVGSADRVAWAGLAAAAMRQHVWDRAAVLHDDAAEALDRHARQVDQLKDLIASIERKARGLADKLLDKLTPPQP